MHNVDQTFKETTIDAFEDRCINALSDEIVGCANCTPFQFLSHLLTYYAMIAPTELTQNYECLNTPYDSNQPIENLFQHIQDAQAFLVAGGQPYGNTMIVNVAFTLVFNTVLFPDACRAWQARAVADNTWMQFKRDFTVAHREFHLMNQTVHKSGFHITNMMIEQGHRETIQDTADTIEHLATATASDRVTVATLTTTNTKLDIQLEIDHAYTKTLNEEVVALKANIKLAWQGQSLTKSTRNANYFWSHGYQVHKDHTGATCKARKDGPHGRSRVGKRMMWRDS
jgi:hypothetical protein